MKKYVNGKISKITDSDLEIVKKIFGKSLKSKNIHDRTQQEEIEK